MVTTPTDICNLALVKLGAETITSLEDGTRNATLCSRVYDLVRQEVLRAHPWNFAMKRINVTSSAPTPAFEWARGFTLPADCLRFWRMYDLSVAYRLEGRRILSDETSINIIYIYDNEDESTFDANFREALALKLASQLGYAVTGSSTPVQLFNELYERVLKQAKMYDAQENIAEHQDDSSWLMARTNSFNYNPGNLS